MLAIKKKKGMVFVKTQTPSAWRRVSKKVAMERGYDIIKCVVCGKNATTIDHYYPYLNDYTLCDECWKKMERGEI